MGWGLLAQATFIRVGIPDGDPDLGQGRRAPGSPREWGFATQLLWQGPRLLWLHQPPAPAVSAGFLVGAPKRPPKEKEIRKERKKENPSSYLQSENSENNNEKTRKSN
jgi:hypothetical protein